MTFKTSMTAAASVAAGAVLTTAVAVFAQGTAAPTPTNTRPVPTQACVQAMATEMADHLSTFDTENAQRKTLMQAQQSALAAAAGIVDDTARTDALKKARDDFHAAMQAAMDGNKEARQAAIKTACGDAFGHGFKMMKGPGFFGSLKGPGHHGMRGHMFNKAAPDTDANANTQTQNP